MPWEVGKLLLQVQWVPRDAGVPAEPPLTPTLAVDEDGDAVRASQHTPMNISELFGTVE